MFLWRSNQKQGVLLQMLAQASLAWLSLEAVTGVTGESACRSRQVVTAHCRSGCHD
jgi:hypothetical protein